MSHLHPVPSTSAPVPAVLEFLSFSVNAEDYGIEIDKVQELRSYRALTAIANAPACLKGVINLRGSIVPVVDLRIHFGQRAPRYDQFTVVVIVAIGGALAGLVVDKVSDVLALDAGQIQPPPRLGSALDARVLIGLGTVAERVLVLIDIESMLHDSELGALGARAHARAPAATH